MHAHVASFPGHIACKFVVPLCWTNGPCDAIIQTIASWAVKKFGFTLGLIQRDHERFGFVDSMWQLELETNLLTPQYYIQPGQPLESLL
jgi:hypothetical protein